MRLCQTIIRFCGFQLQCNGMQCNNWLLSKTKHQNENIPIQDLWKHSTAIIHPSFCIIRNASGLATEKQKLSKTGETASLPPSSTHMQQGELSKHINIQSLQTDRITAIVGPSMVPHFLSLQSSLSTICTCTPFGNFEFGSFTSVKFLFYRLFDCLEGSKRGHGNIQAVKAHCTLNLHDYI